MHRYQAGFSAGSSQKKRIQQRKWWCCRHGEMGPKSGNFTRIFLTLALSAQEGIREKDDIYMRYTFICASISIVVHIPILEYVCAKLRVVCLAIYRMIPQAG